MLNKDACLKNKEIYRDVALVILVNIWANYLQYCNCLTQLKSLNCFQS